MPKHVTHAYPAVSAIVPAYNEQDTIVSVIRTLERHPLIAEVIVVSDGSTDKTAQRARHANAIVIELQENVGKGGAMDIGVRHAMHDVLLFADADLVGLTDVMITGLVTRVSYGGYDMFTLIRDRKSELFQLHLPANYTIGGERVLRRALWEAVPTEDRQGYCVELALNYYAVESGMCIGHGLAPGLGQVIKEQKRGLFLGFALRMQMVAQCIKILLKLHVLGRNRAFV